MPRTRNESSWWACWQSAVSRSSSERRLSHARASSTASRSGPHCRSSASCATSMRDPSLVRSRASMKASTTAVSSGSRSPRWISAAPSAPLRRPRPARWAASPMAGAELSDRVPVGGDMLPSAAVDARSRRLRLQRPQLTEPAGPIGAGDHQVRLDESPRRGLSSYERRALGRRAGKTGSGKAPGGWSPRRSPPPAPPAPQGRSWSVATPPTATARWCPHTRRRPRGRCRGGPGSARRCRRCAGWLRAGLHPALTGRPQSVDDRCGWRRG